MKRNYARYCLLGALAVFSGASFSAKASIQSELWGTAAPQATLGGYPVIPFELDGRPIGDPVTTFSPPGGSPVIGDVLSDTPLGHFQVGNGWVTWSHGYAGDVYWMDEDSFGNYDPLSDTYSSSLTLLLPAGTKAFYFYLEPTLYSAFEFVVSSENASELLLIDGNAGAQGIGFYSDDPGQDLLSIAISRQGTFSDGYGIGEFGINGDYEHPVPETPAPLALLGLAIGGLLAARRRGLRA